MMENVPEVLQPFGVELDLERGEMIEPKRHLVRRASDMRGYYADEAALEELIAAGDPVHYEVFEVPVPEEQGQLMYCISKLQPGTVGQECFMTKGHYHAVNETSEIYLPLRGEGYLLLKRPEGICDAQPMKRGRMVYAPPVWAHRSVNTSDEPLVSFCIYPGQAGHNYGDIKEDGFPKQIFKINGRIRIA